MNKAIFATGALIFAAVAMAIPSAHANTTQCDPTGATNACVNTYTYNSDSSTDCTSAASHTWEVSASESDGTTYRNAYVYNYCYNDPAWGSSGSGIGAGYYSFDSSTWAFSEVGGQWYSYAYPGGSGCDSGFYSFGNAPIPDGYNSLGCPAGAAPFIPAPLP
ncbi:MAG: hypothetical protein ACYDCK_06930 [Thermoplasmatota archaeon]